MHEDLDDYKWKFNSRTIIKNIDDKIMIGCWEMSLVLTYIFTGILLLSVFVIIGLCMTVWRDDEMMDVDSPDNSRLKKQHDNEWYYDESIIA